MTTPHPQIFHRAFRNCTLWPALCLLLFCLAGGAAPAQTHSSEPQAQKPVAAAEGQHGKTAASGEKGEKAESGGNVSTQTSPTEVEEEETAQFKHSKSVAWISSKLGLSPEAGYWVFLSINFLVIVGFIYWISRTSLVQTMRNRTAAIQKGLEEARKASAEANARLRDVQERLAKLDLEVAQIRGSADADFQAEEQRIRQAAEQDAGRVIEQAKSEIDAMAKSARRELKTYAAELAVEMARRNISVDAQTDSALVRSFASELTPQRMENRHSPGTPLGKDGK